MALRTEQASPAETRVLARSTLVFFWLTLITTTVLCLRWSHNRLFWVDEFLEYYTDAKPSVVQIIAGQLHAPFSLEPPGFHLLLHLTHRLLPWPEFAARLPSIGALLLTEICSFFLVLRLTRSQVSSVLAMLMPFYLVTVDYGVESRAYSAVTACMAVALLSWTYLATGGRRRPLALTGLVGALAGAVLMHFYGVFLLAPLYAGELFRTWERKRLDRQVAGAILLATAAILIDLPFARALGPFRQHYYSNGETQWSNVPFTYYWFYRHFRIYTDPVADVQRYGLITLCVVAIVVGWSLWRAGKSWRTPGSSAAVQVALSVTALLPVLNLLAAQVTKAYVPRYSLPGVVGVGLLSVFLIRDFVVLPRVQIAFACFLALGAVRYARALTSTSAEARDGELSQLQLTPEQQKELSKLPDQHIYLQDVARYLFLHYYVPPDRKKDLVGVYSISCELHWAGRNPSSIFSRNIGATTDVPFQPVAALFGRSGPHLLVLYHDPHEEWIESELDAEGVEPVSLGRAFGGDLVEVNLPGQSTCDTDPSTNGSGAPKTARGD